MPKIAGLVVLLGASLAATRNLAAQSIVITPSGTPQVVVGGSVQFSAQVTGLSSTAVVWSAGGAKGGNSTAGTISTAGLYQAPASLPGQNPVQIKATSAVNSTVSSITYVYLLSLGPTITSVSPNPVAVGTITVTVQGSTFQTGTMVYITYGSNSLIQMSTTAVTPTSVTATGYLGPSTSASFCVKNPGSGYSNALTVPVGKSPPPPTKYTLTVVGGSGGGSYAASTVVTITATPPSGQSFVNWTGATVKNSNASPTTLTMPAANTTVTANFSGTATKYTLTVVNGSGGGSYTAGTLVTITATPPTGQSFVNWTGAAVANAGASPTTLTMPQANTTVTANCTATKYSLIVVNGSGGGSYAAGTVVTITATPPSGQSFVNWTGATVANAGTSPTTLTMPPANTTVTANCTATKYTLTVVNGSGGNSYAAGTVVTITATPPSGQSFVNWTGATVQNANASPTTLTMPAANTTVTANCAPTPMYTLTVVGGSGTGSYTAGTQVPIAAGAAPTGEFFVNWTGAAVANASAASTTLSMPPSNTTVTANYAAVPTIPYPVSTHPRLWVTPNDLPHLQKWAVSTNPVYQQGMLPLLNQVVSIYNTQFFPNGQPNPTYPDPGDVQGYQGDLTEQYGFILAFNSLIDPLPANRILYAQYTRNLLMYAMNLAALGPLAGAPFRDPMFAVYNRANGSGEQWPLMVDWIYNATDANGIPILSASDKATIRNVFLMWANQCLNASTTGGDHPSPIGAMNSLQLLPNNQPYRMASNNYYLGHARLLTMMALSIDPGDDPPVNANAPASQVGNTLRSYILDANGAWLYQMFAMMGDPSVVASAYGIAGNGAGFGLASGGLPPEGMLYGHSFAYVLSQLLSLQTAGFNNASITGPQIQLINAPVWDRYVRGYMSSLVPTAQVYASQPWLGPVYEYASYGDLLRLWVTPEVMQSFTLLALLEQQNGLTTHLNAARWFAVNASEGGANALMTRITQPFSYSSTASVLYFLLLDPLAPTATDPRLTFPATFFDPAAGRILAHSDWTPTGTMFDYRASWISINHQLGDGGQFELYRKGEWLTKEMSNYDNNALGMTSMYHNTLALQNWCADGTPANLQWYESGEWANGSMWMEGLDAGDPTTVSSTGPGYVYAASNLTNLFNRPDYWSPNDAAINIAQATRSIVWLNNDYVVVYDRATTLASGLFKRFNLSLVTNPTIAGNVATETLASGQQLFVETLLPHSPSITAAYDVALLNPVAQLEPTQYILTVEDLTRPTDARFLHVLQGADPGASMAAATYVQSSSGSGTSFDGAVLGSTAVYFPVSGNGAFAGATLSVPTGVHTVLVTGLAANGSYSVGVAGSAIAISSGSGATADGAGVLRVTL